MTTRRIAAIGVVLTLALVVAGCRGQENGASVDGGTETAEATAGSVPAEAPATLMSEDAAALLWQLINDEDYTSWDAAPGFAARQPATGPHGDEVMIFVNDAVSDRLRTRDAGGLPADSVIVKDVYSGGSLDAIAVMQKTDDLRWYWAEYAADGTVIAEGLEIPLCADCHSESKDHVRSFEVP